MKYVILKIDLGGARKAFPIIFSDHLCHVDVAKDMGHRIWRDTRHEATVHSAGFIALHHVGVHCYRGSETLKIEREEERSAEDERLIGFHDSTSGIML